MRNNIRKLFDKLYIPTEHGLLKQFIHVESKSESLLQIEHDIGILQHNIDVLRALNNEILEIGFTKEEIIEKEKIIQEESEKER